MKKFMVLIVVSLLGFILTLGLPVDSTADLILQEPVAGELVVFDTDTNLMWIHNANYNNNNRMSYSNAWNWADTLDYGGYTDWRLPTADSSCGFSFNCTTSEMGHLYYTELRGSQDIPPSDWAPFTNVTDVYWTSTQVSSRSSIFVYDFYPGVGWQGQAGTQSGPEGSRAAAWAVRSVVPEPISSILFIVGGATLGLRRFRIKFT